MIDRTKLYLPLIDSRLESVLKELDAPEILVKAMAHSLLNGGKRVRPVLTMEFASICGGEPEKVLDAACAVECIHTYSLIHDDLPCMDDDDFRRGKPACHKAFGEANALLAGDALLTLAFGLMMGSDADDYNKAKACQCLSYFAGPCGMVGGQVIDLECEGKQIDVSVLEKLHYGKTCCLIKAACMIGCILAGGTKEQIDAAESYAYNLGMAFQIIDDILDVVGDEKTLGKPIASDEENNKTTYVTLFGVDECRRLAHEYTQKACTALDIFGKKAQWLTEYALLLEQRIL